METNEQPGKGTVIINAISDNRNRYNEHEYNIEKVFFGKTKTECLGFGWCVKVSDHIIKGRRNNEYDTTNLIEGSMKLNIITKII